MDIEKIKKAYKEYCGLDLVLSNPITSEKITGALKYAKNIMIDEAELGYDNIINMIDDGDK